MDYKIFGFCQKILFGTFIVGVAFLFVMKAASEYLIASLVNKINYALIVIWYLVGLMALVLNYLGEKAMDEHEGATQECEEPNSGLYSYLLNSNLDNYENLNKQFDTILNLELDNTKKFNKFLSLLCNEMKVGRGVLFKMQMEEGMPKLKFFTSYGINEDFAVKSMNGFSKSHNFYLCDKEIYLTRLCEQQEVLNSGGTNSTSDLIQLIPVQSENVIKGILELTFIEPINLDKKKFIENHVAKMATLL